MEYFITGIDTDIGKTFITKTIAYLKQKKGYTVGVFKPLQSGAVKKENKYLAPDLEAITSLSKNINTKCSYLFEGEVSPALAAHLAGVNIDIDKIKADFNEFSKINDITLVEGAGGILAPITDSLLCADLIKLLNIPIIIVTVPFLGRLNHTLLTIYFAKSNNLNIKGIVINKVPKYTNNLASKNFISELTKYTDVPIIGTINDMGTNVNMQDLEEVEIII